MWWKSILRSTSLISLCWDHEGDRIMLTNIEATQMIAEAIESIWKNEVKADYETAKKKILEAIASKLGY